MANITIYPYGTEGTLPSSIGIINDLKTGGVDKALSAEMGKELVEVIDEAKSDEWITKDIYSTWTDGALVARADDSAYNTIVSNADWKTTDYVDVEDYTHLLYSVPQTTNSTGLAIRAGIIFYDSEHNALVGFAGGQNTTTGLYKYSIPIPSTAKYVRISTWGADFFSGVKTNQLAKKSGYGKNKDSIEQLSELGVVGGSLPLSISAADNTNVVRSIVGNFVTEIKIGSSIDFAYRFNIDISGRDMSKYYIFRMKYSCSLDIPSTVAIGLKDVDNIIWVKMGDPAIFPYVSNPYLYLNGVRSGEYLGIIPPYLYDCVYVSIDSHKESSRSRMEFSDISINEFIPNATIQSEHIVLWGTPIEYIGEKINVNKNRAFAEQYMTITAGCQAMCCFGDYAFLHKNKGQSIDVFNLRTKKKLQTVSITGNSSNARNHGNSASFSNIYYEEGDEFPIMYVSSGYTIDGYPRAFGLRVVKTVENNTETFAITLVHTITLNNDSWAEFVFAGDILYIRTVVDEVDSWCWTMTPDITEDVTLELTELKHIVPFDDYIHRIMGSDTQGYSYHNNRIFTTWGSVAPYYFGMVNPETGQIATMIPLADWSINEEPESVFYWDGNLYMNTYAGKIFRLFFD